MATETDGCAICEAVATPSLLRGVRDHLSGDVFAIRRCPQCGYGRTEPVPRSLDRYYPTRYRRFGRVAAFALRRLYLRRVDGWLPRLPETGVALEIGSGTGWMLGALQARGWRAIGSERSVESAAIAAAASSAPMFVGDLDSTVADRALDLIVMFHVLEHLPDPLAVLRRAADRLRPGGTLIVGVPNAASWQARFAGRRWMHLDVPRHLVHFTPRSIERALLRSGFSVADVRFTSYEHDPLAWVQAFLERIGFEDGIVLKTLFRSERRAGPVATVIAALLWIPLGIIGSALALASWRAGAGALMEVWAVREAD